MHLCAAWSTRAEEADLGGVGILYLQHFFSFTLRSVFFASAEFAEPLSIWLHDMLGPGSSLSASLRLFAAFRLVDPKRLCFATRTQTMSRRRTLMKVYFPRQSECGCRWEVEGGKEDARESGRVRMETAATSSGWTKPRSDRGDWVYATPAE